jgi:hypothetical protein
MVFVVGTDRICRVELANDKPGQPASTAIPELLAELGTRAATTDGSSYQLGDVEPGGHTS